MICTQFTHVFFKKIHIVRLRMINVESTRESIVCCGGLDRTIIMPKDEKVSNSTSVSNWNILSVDKLSAIVIDSRTWTTVHCTASGPPLDGCNAIHTHQFWEKADFTTLVENTTNSIHYKSIRFLRKFQKFLTINLNSLRGPCPAGFAPRELGWEWGDEI